MIYKLLVVVILFAPLWPMNVEPFPGEPYVMINKSTNELGWVEDGELVDVYNVATGKEAGATPEGVFTVSVKAKEPYYRAKNIEGGSPDNPLGSRWIGIDAAASDGRTYGVHGTNDDESIGKNVSLGCVRMHNEEVNRLYDQVPLGTKVWIGTEPKKDMIDIAAENGVLHLPFGLFGLPPAQVEESK